MRLLPLILIAACTGTEPEDTSDSERPDAPWPSAEQEVYALNGEVTWHVDFDAEAEAAGKTDCSYTRRYTGLEDRSRPWTCRGCHVIVRAEVEMVDGLDDCYAQVTEATPAPVEWIGYAGGIWYRTGVENRPLSEAASARVSNGGFDIAVDVPSESYDGYGLTFTLEGRLDGGLGTGDLYDGLLPPETSACGWSRAIVEEYDGSTRLREEATLPDAHLLDACGEGVRLHQLTGDERYAVIAWVAGGEAASQSWLDEAVASVAGHEPAIQPIAVASLAADDVWTSPTAEQLAALAPDPSLPVLGHRGYGRTVMANGDDFTWPVVAIVAPDRTVIRVERGGFSGWQSALAAIDEHASLP
ncbi:MAG: hypothetical protein EP330_18715 [Deltaproteobacteria bacterium]|nr:MAG: hypothetical protein EP330_18715 [Deltaproteobacteria bacterium]